MSDQTNNESKECPTNVVGIILFCGSDKDRFDKALKSILEQDYPYKIVCIVKNGINEVDVRSLLSNVTQEFIIEDSGDTVAIAQIDGTPVIYLERDIDMGITSIKNSAIKLLWQYAELFCIVQDDTDALLPNKLSKSVSAYLDSPKYIGAVYCDHIINDTRDGARYTQYKLAYSRKRMEEKNLIGNAPIISKTALGFSGLYDETLDVCEDWDLLLKITENFLAIHIPEALQEYLIYPDNTTFDMTDDEWNNKRKIIYKNMMERRKINGTST